MSSDKMQTIQYFVTNAVVIDDDLWFCSAWYTFLFRCNLLTKEVVEVVELPKGKNLFSPYVYMFSIENNIYLLSETVDNPLIKYNIASKDVESVQINIDGTGFGDFFDEDDE